MRKYFLSLTLISAGAFAMAGCASKNEFSPTADPTQMAAYAATAHYPIGASPVDNPKLTAVVDHSNGQIKIRNYGTGLIANFKLWVNESYVLHVDRLDPGSSRVFNKNDLYNAGGNSMEGVPPDGIRKIQIENESGELWNVQGPLME